MLDRIKKFLKAEADAIKDAADLIDDKFEAAIDLIYKCQGKVVVTGIGKSGLIGRKIAATLTSTGTNATFLHPTEAFHGDLGIVHEGDVVLAMAYSGETTEMLHLFPYFKRRGNPIILITGRPNSSLANQSTLTLDINVKDEICPINRAPTSSSIVTLAFGDAIALSLMELKGFTEEDFANSHPGGSLGRKLLTRVSDLMHPESEIPHVVNETPMEEIILTMSGPNFGIIGVYDQFGNLLGAVTDGDLRRSFKSHGAKAMSLNASHIMTTNPKWILQNELAEKALHIMEKFKITVLFVKDNPRSKKIIGLIHMHDLLKNKII